MLSALRDQFIRAGFKNPNSGFTLLAATSCLAAALTYEALGLLVVATAVAIGVTAIALDAIGKRANRRSKQIVEQWPSVLESIESAAIAGLSLTEAFRELAESHSLVVAPEFSKLVNQLESGQSMDTALASLGQSLALPACDLTIAILRQVNRSGGNGLSAAMRSQAATAREFDLLVSQLQAKQGWVMGTAKLAVAAPWVVVALVCVRPENARLYASPTGVTLTSVGLIGSLLAYRMVSTIGRLNFQSRVLQ